MVPAHPGCHGQNLESRKTVVCVCVRVCVCVTCNTYKVLSSTEYNKTKCTPYAPTIYIYSSQFNVMPDVHMIQHGNAKQVTHVGIVCSCPYKMTGSQLQKLNNVSQLLSDVTDLN